MFTHALDDRTHLALMELGHAADLLALVGADREHLRPWMVWLDGTREVSDTEAFIGKVREGWAKGTNLNCGIWHDGALAGVIDLHTINRKQGTAEIGYWISAAHEGKGLITKACRAILDYGFGSLGLRRIEISCATDNVRSRAVPERLGFVQEGVLRELLSIQDRLVDHAVYAMLARDWPKDR